MMKSEYLRALKYSEESILEDLLVTDVIPDLRACKSFTLSDQENIYHETTSEAKVVKLIDIIRTKDDKCFEKFLDILRTTNEELAEQLQSNINPNQNTRRRRLSQTEVGEILVKGGVPDLTSTYIPRKPIEDQILNLLTSNSKKPILVHGIVGCGKSSLITNLLHTDRLFPDRFLTCCWLSIGNISQQDVIKTLAILEKKLNIPNNNSLQISNIPEILVENIKERLRDMTTLLILDDVWNGDIMKYFTFQCKYIVISRRSDIFSYETADVVPIPECFDEVLCTRLLQAYKIDSKLFPMIREKSHQNPMCLSMIGNAIKSNPDYIRVICQMNAQTYMENILKEYINIIDLETRDYYEMLVILRSDVMLIVDMLSIYWDVDTNKALQITGKLCDNNFLYKKWNQEYNCNTYGIYNLHLEYLQNQKTKEQLKNFQNLFIERYLAKYRSWLDIDHTDPSFIKLYATILADRKDFKKLQKLYTDFKFLAAKIVICGIGDLMFDYERHNWFDNNANCIEFEQFLMKYVHKFIRLSNNTDIILKIGKVFTSLIQLGLYEMKESITYKLAYETKVSSKRSDFWKMLNPQHSIKTWEVSDGDNITHVDVNQDAILLASDKGQIRLLQNSTGKFIFNYKISENNIILVKFTDRLEFLVIDSIGKSWKFDPMALLLPNMSSLQMQYSYDEYDDDNDFRSTHQQTFKNSIDFLYLKNQFKDITTHDFIKRCQSFLNNVKEKIYSKAFLTPSKIVLLESMGNSTYIGVYDHYDGQMNNDFYVSFGIQKLAFGKDIFYALQDCGKEISVLNEFGNVIECFSINDQVIIDFCIYDSKIFCAVENKIYVDQDLLFSVDSTINIRSISMSPDKSLLVISLTTDSVQLWKYSSNPPELVYILNDSQVVDLYISQNSDSLITIGQTNLAKWNILSLSNNNQNNNNENENYVSDHRTMFALQELAPDTFVLMTQSFNNHLKFYEFQQETFNLKILAEHVEVTCYHTCGAVGFIGFTGGLVKIYDLNMRAEVGKINTDSNVINMFAFQVDKSVLGLVTCHIHDYRITFYQLNYRSYEILRHCQLDLPRNMLPVTKFFKSIERDLILATRFESSCVFYKLKEDQLCKAQSFNWNHGIVDVDISDNSQYLCLIATTCQVKIWRLDLAKSIFYKELDNAGVLRKCLFRPMKNDQDFKTLAVINDQAEVFLIYFTDTESIINIIIEDFHTTVWQLPQAMVWSSDANYLLVGDYDIRKWKVPLKPRNKEQVKLPLTKLQTFFGGIQSIQLTENTICTIDKQGFIYVLKRID